MVAETGKPLGIVFHLRPFSNTVLQRTVSTPKMYFHDTGLDCHLVRWSDPRTLMNGAIDRDNLIVPVGMI